MNSCSAVSKPISAICSMFFLNAALRHVALIIIFLPSLLNHTIGLPDSFTYPLRKNEIAWSAKNEVLPLPGRAATRTCFPVRRSGIELFKQSRLQDNPAPLVD